MSFSVLGLSAPLVRAVDAAGYSVPTPVQVQAIPPVLEGRDLLGCSQTGSGKTAAFALPIIHRLAAVHATAVKGRRRIRALVLAPTRELAAQIGNCFLKYGHGSALRTSVIFGGVNQQRQTRDLQRGVEIVVATPGRLLDLYQQGFVDFGAVETVVLDEADQMLDMGFLPDVRRILGRLPAKRQTLFFSATMPPPIRELASEILHDPVQIRIAPEQSTAEGIEQGIYLVPKDLKLELLAHLIGTRPAGSTLVFTRTKHGADGVVRKLAKLGIDAEAIHGNKSQNARERALGSFRKGDLQVLVATDIASRGIDVRGISYVINYDFPATPEAYVHRIGRTGRAGDAGNAVSLCSGEERPLLAALERHLRKRLVILQDGPPALQTLDRPLRRPASVGANPGGSRHERPRRNSGGAIPAADHPGFRGSQKPGGRPSHGRPGSRPGRHSSAPRTAR
jgi:ATP-dependent RNA helicase RhlE